jgi:hypothetical protein
MNLHRILRRRLAVLALAPAFAGAAAPAGAQVDYPSKPIMIGAEV